MEKSYNKREYNGNRRNSGRVSYRNDRNTEHRNEDREHSQNFNREDRNTGKNRFYTERRDVNKNSTERREERPVFRRRERNEGNRNTGNGYTPRNYYRREEDNNNREQSADRNPDRTEFRRNRTDRPFRENNYGRERKEDRNSRDTNYRSNREHSYQRGEEKEERRRISLPRKREYDNRQESVDETRKEELRKKHYSKKKLLAHRLKTEKEDAELRLNRYISMGGVCSRRDADALITEGRVKVNGEVVQTVGVKVRKNDRVEVDDVIVIPERKVYLVLNKPKDYVTTVEDPLERKTVMNLIDGACKERIYPVGRLDRQTTGVLLFTNDGDLAKKLTHPKYEHKKIYHVFLDKPLEPKDMDAISTGIELEDGLVKADEISYVADDRTQVGIEIHSGRNRIVRRIFEHLGYQIVRLDRVYFAGITKKNLPRGRWRFLTPQEVKILKIYNV